MKEKKSVLVIGASGFLGKGISCFYLDQKFPVIGIDVIAGDPGLNFNAFYVNRLSENASSVLMPILKEWKPDLIIYAAGKASVAESFQLPEEDYLAGPFLCFQIMETIRKYSPESRLLFISSAAVYGQPEKLPICETMPSAPLSPYGYHKRICEIQIEEYVRLFHLKAAIVRIFSAYGNGIRKQIIWDICNKCRSGGDILLSGTGNETRDFIHVNDIAKAIMLIQEKGSFEGTVYNIASGTEESIFNLARLIIEKYGSNTNRLRFTGESRIGDPQNWCADISRLNALAFKPAVSLADGIGEYVQWFKEIHQK